MSERRGALDKILGKKVVAYSLDPKSELALKFEDGTILEWWDYYCEPTDPDEQGTRETVEERLEGTWVKVDDSERETE